MDKLKKKICIFTIAYNQVGQGHLKRSLLLKKLFKTLGIQIKIFLIKSPSQKKLIFLLKNLISKNYFIILDLSNKSFFKKSIFIKHLKKRITFFKKNLLIIDSPNDDSLVKYLGKKVLYICPYFSENKNTNKINNVKFFLFDKKIKQIKKGIPKVIKNILITFGGSDLGNCSLKFLNYFNNTSIKIRIIIGPYFKTKKIKELKNLKNKNKNLILLKFNDKFYDYINKSDLIITSTGLTKYELCLTNKLFIVYSHNLNDLKNNQTFAKKKLSINLSYKDSERKIKKLLYQVISNPKKFSFHLNNRKYLFDFNAHKRILSKIVMHEKFRN